ncbi:MAG: hypothetical protein AB1331_05465 [Bacillota bacterium]
MRNRVRILFHCFPRHILNRRLIQPSVSVGYLPDSVLHPFHGLLRQSQPRLPLAQYML